MNQFNTTIATLSIAAAGVFAVAGIAKADGTHHHAYSHVPHTHTYAQDKHVDQHGNALGNAIVLGGLLIGGIALLDALSNAQNDADPYHGYVAPKTYPMPRHYYTPKTYIAPKPIVTVKPYPVPKPTVITHKPKVTYTTSCRDHNHIGISWDGPREFSLRRPNGSVLTTINAGRPVMKRVAHALDAFGLDTTCVIKSIAKNGKVEKSRLFLANGRLARVPANWGGADRIIKLNPDTLVVNKLGASKFSVLKPNGTIIATFETRMHARSFIAFLDEKNARKKVIIQNRQGENKFAFYAR
ncbi:MAG: hypothetical protein ACPG40_11750 [Alphaproteobacteria bacterium]